MGIRLMIGRQWGRRYVNSVDEVIKAVENELGKLPHVFDILSKAS